MKQRFIWSVTLLVVMLLMVVSSCAPAATSTSTPNPTPATSPTSTQRQRTNGTLTNINGNILTLTTAQGPVTVNIISDNTSIQNVTTGTLSDLHEGQSLTVMGQQDASGNITARSIIIQPQGQSAPPAPPSGS